MGNCSISTGTIFSESLNTSEREVEDRKKINTYTQVREKNVTLGFTLQYISISKELKKRKKIKATGSFGYFDTFFFFINKRNFWFLP